MAAKVTDVHVRRRALREGVGFKASDARAGAEKKNPLEPSPESPQNRSENAPKVGIQPITTNLPPERSPQEAPADRFHKKAVVHEFHDAPSLPNESPAFDPEAEAAATPVRRRTFHWKRELRFLRRWVRRQSQATIASWVILAVVALTASGFIVSAARSRPVANAQAIAGGSRVAEAVAAGNYVKALELTDAELAKTPESFALRANKAGFLAYLGRLDEAESLYAQLLSEQPGSQRILMNLAETRFAKRDFRGAVPLYQRLVLKPATSELSTFRLYVCHRALGENPAAITLSASQTLKVGGPTRFLVEAMEAERRGNVKKAAALREEARSLHPEATAVLEKSIEGIALAPSASLP